MSKICPECGCVNDNDNARFCNDCGAKFEVNNPVPQTPRIKLKEVSGDDKVEGKKETPTDTSFRPAEVSKAENVVVKPVTSKETTIDLPEEDDDDSDYGEVTVEPVSFDSVEENEEFDDDGDDFEQPLPIEQSVKNANESVSTEGVKNNQTDDEVTNDPYYDDILPEIDNEIRAIPRDVIFKIAGAVLVLIAAGFYMIMMWS